MSLRSLTNSPAHSNPTVLRLREPSVYYWDNVQIRTDRKLNHAQRRHCQNNSGHFYEEYDPLEFDPRFPWRYQLKQPKDEAFEPFRERRYSINHTETACDLCFPNVTERMETNDFLHEHKLRRWHDKKHGVRKYEGGDPGKGQNNRYDSPRQAANVCTWYEEDCSRITGEPNCLHLEWRMNGSRACKRKGIYTIDDLLAFDHKGFLLEELSQLYAVDKERLGRIIRNKRMRSRRRKPETAEWVKGVPFNLDLKLGGLLCRACPTVQELADTWGMNAIRPALFRIRLCWDQSSAMKSGVKCNKMHLASL